MVDRKAKFAILSYFQKAYAQATGGETLTINKYSAQWDADALIESYEVEPLKKMIDRYFKYSDHPSWKGFCRDSQKVWEAQAIEALDQAERKISKQRVKEWLKD